MRLSSSALPSITPHVSGVRHADSLKSYLATLDLVAGSSYVTNSFAGTGTLQIGAGGKLNFSGSDLHDFHGEVSIASGTLELKLGNFDSLTGYVSGYRGHPAQRVEPVVPKCAQGGDERRVKLRATSTKERVGNLDASDTVADVGPEVGERIAADNLGVDQVVLGTLNR